MDGDAKLERYPPVMMHCLLSAVRRFEPDFYAHLCRAYHLDADRILGLFSEVEELGAAQLTAMVGELREHQAYHEIVFLAGRNALHTYAEQQHARPSPLLTGASRFNTLAKQLLPAFLGRSSYVLMSRGNLQFVELHDSVFARGVHAVRPLCGFYCGFLAELGSTCVPGAAISTEVRCVALEPDATSCLLQISL